MDRKTFWATKNPAATYQTVTFEHPVFDAPFRLVFNKYAAVTLGGDEYRPVGGSVKTPDSKSQTQPKLVTVFPRQVVGREFKQQLRLIKAAGSRDPIAVTWALWLGETDAPKATWAMYASDQGGIAFSNDAVQVTAAIDNPMRRQVALLYTPEVFTGLETT